MSWSHLVFPRRCSASKPEPPPLLGCDRQCRRCASGLPQTGASGPSTSAQAWTISLCGNRMASAALEEVFVTCIHSFPWTQ